MSLPIQRYFRILSLMCLFLCIFISNNAFALPFSEQEGASSSCFVTDRNGAVLMVEEIATGKYRLPGGLIRSGFSSEESALWHLNNESGFNAYITYDLGKLGKHQIYACRLLTTRNFFVNKEGDKVVLGWITLLSSKDVSVPLLLPIDDDKIKNYAYPKEVNYFSDFLQNAIPSKFIVIKDGLEILPKTYLVQHKWLITVRDWVLSFEAMAKTAKHFPMINTFMLPLLLIISVPFFRAYYGFRAMLIFSAGLTYLAGVSILFNQYLPIPPPYFVDLSFIPMDLNRFGFPAYEVTFFSFVFGWLAMIWPSRKYKKEKYLIALLSIIFVLISSVKSAIFGESYPLTIFASIVFGLLSSYALSKMKDIRLGDRQRALISKRFWIWTTLLWAAVAYISDITRMFYIAAFCVGLTIALFALKGKTDFARSVKPDVRFPFFLFSTLGLILIFIIAVYIIAGDPRGANVSSFRIFAMFIAPIWMLWIMPKIFRQNFLKTEEKNKE